METKTRKQRATEIIARTRDYTGLWADPRFQEWKSRVVEGRLEQWQKEVMTLGVDPTMREVSVLAYHKVKSMFDEFFTAMQNNEDKARKVLKEKS